MGRRSRSVEGVAVSIGAGWPGSRIEVYAKSKSSWLPKPSGPKMDTIVEPSGGLWPVAVLDHLKRKRVEMGERGSSRLPQLGGLGQGPAE